MKKNGIKNSTIEGRESDEWKLIDGSDIIVHIFHPEIRRYYRLEELYELRLDEKNTKSELV